MKTLITIVFFVLLLSSCHSLDNNSTTLLNLPVGEVELTVSNETFTVDFECGAICLEYMKDEVLKDNFTKLKTRDDLINYYKTLKPVFLPGYSSIWPDNNEYLFIKVEYMLAQECFSDYCKSEIRKDILQLAVNFQKYKYGENTRPFCAQKSGIFLMAVILVKERNSSAKYIDATNLQQALLCFSNDMYVDENFSKSIIESAEIFLIDNKK